MTLPGQTVSSCLDASLPIGSYARRVSCSTLGLTDDTSRAGYDKSRFGGVAERLKATVLKTVWRATVTGVRIPPPPFSFLQAFSVRLSITQIHAARSVRFPPGMGKTARNTRLKKNSSNNEAFVRLAQVFGRIDVAIPARIDAEIVTARTGFPAIKGGK